MDESIQTELVKQLRDYFKIEEEITDQKVIELTKNTVAYAHILLHIYATKIISEIKISLLKDFKRIKSIFIKS